MRIALGIEYDGTSYNGWQRQRSGVGVQEPVEEALASVADEPVEAICAGRTDAGVHASGQVVHFDSNAERSMRDWLLGANSNLPADINALWAQTVADDFHARFSATSRTYRYLILNRLVRSSLYREHAWWVHQELDVGAMQEAAKHLLGEHDFTAFRASGCRAKTPVREIFSIEIESRDEWISISVRANAFLQHMVRNIAGLLVAIGAGEESPHWADTLMQSRDRTRGGIAAPPHGLTLIAVDYPEQFGLPQPRSDAHGALPDFVYDASL